MKTTTEFLNEIAIERPVGTEPNQHVLTAIQEEALQRGYDFILLPFECKTWRRGKSYIEAGNTTYEIFPSPFSEPYTGSGEMAVVHSSEELAETDFNGKLLFLRGAIAADALMPKGYPFYYPDEHKRIIDLLEEKKPIAVIAVTGRHPMCGLEPFPMFEDGNFSIPSAYTDEATAARILENSTASKLCIASGVSASKSSQIVITKRAQKESQGKIMVCAHMDTKYDTPGALDNAAGVAVLLETMEKLKGYAGCYDLEFVPSNGEEYYEAKGELAYLEYLGNSITPVKLVINIDGPCHKASQTAVSSYNFDDELGKKLNEEMSKRSNIVSGPQWYAGDHSVFAYQELPCIAVTSSNLFEGVLELTHTDKDTIDQVSYGLISETADFLAGFVKSVSAE